MSGVSLSQQPFESQDYNDGEIYRLVPGSQLWVALTQEVWLNCSQEIRNYYVDRLLARHHFSGTIVSKTRQQVELTYIPLGDVPTQPGPVEIIAVSLANMHRFY